ncbi:uncharacterized protein LOC118712079 isoform X3 [Pipistrellus kuhlii]|uniref:Uncharacterized protein n=1 Tax=Pipistrellus kuhlii TaxID=59472 RepID=A0A7J7RD18_PIPKU|nr:uncharacterized protein LOC118712079 isoform X3 [Pipistrellus kuhlii]KAF6274080.1 hypothetical protein mPipKuh1_010681 [Pipistrellus kuhlii]
MVFGICGQKERLCRVLYLVQVLILAGMVYYYFQEPGGKTASDHETAGESSLSTGETLRPLWGLMDKCYPVATQRRRVRSGKKQAPEATTPEAPGGLNDAAPKEERDMLSAGERAGAGEGTVPGQGAASPTPAGKDVAEEKELAGSPGWEEAKVPAEPALPPSGDLQGLPVGAGEASAVQSQEERPGGWAPRLLRKLWLGWFPVSDGPETQKHQ